MRKNQVYIRNSPDGQEHIPKKFANEPPRSPNRFRSKVSESAHVDNLANTIGSPTIPSEPVAQEISPTVRF